MNRFLSIILLLLLSVSVMAIPDNFVRVENGRFFIGSHEYRYVGVNIWYAAILASEGQGGDRKRLQRELDLMQRVGINNLRVLVGADGETDHPSHVAPVLQTSPGVYNDTILRGLDYLMAELERRDMKAVLYLNNSWEWSGGFGTYLNWAGAGPVPESSDWDAFQRYHSQFVLNPQAMKMAEDHVRFIVTRINTITGRPYAECPALMAWEICNEPRAFNRQPEHKQAFAQWIHDQALFIKTLDPNHLVTTGSEGLYGCEVDMELFRQIHSFPCIDYACIHIWPFNWSWLGKFCATTAEAREANTPESVITCLDNAFRKTDEYIEGAYKVTQEIGCPLVLEEFGYPRDSYSIKPGSPTRGRDRYYRHVLEGVRDGGKIAGCNFWGWGGYAKPAHDRWQRWDDYVGDPSQEEQGLYSIFATDKSTLKLIRQMAKDINTY